MGTGCKLEEENESQQLESFARRMKLNPFSTKASMPRQMSQKLGVSRRKVFTNSHMNTSEYGVTPARTEVPQT